MDDDPIEPEDENEAMEWKASEEVMAYDRKIIQLKLELQKMKVERNRWENLRTSIRVSRIQVERARQMVMSNLYSSILPYSLDAPHSPSASFSGPSTHM